MAHSLEVRVPILDHQLVDWISGLSPGLKMRGREGKYIFKKSLQAQLPDAILYRQKMGFSIPLASWFRGPLQDRVRQGLLGETMAESGMFNMRYLSRLVEQHQSGVRDYSSPIWTLLMFAAFLKSEAGQ